MSERSDWLEDFTVEKTVLREAQNALSCPFFFKGEKCTSGCYSEPACVTQEPMDGWDGQRDKSLQRLRRMIEERPR